MGAVEKSLVASEPHMSAADEPRVLCIIQNTLNASDKLTHNWPTSMTCGQVFAEVAKELSVQSSAIDLYYEPPNTDAAGERQQVSVNAEPSRTIGELCSGGNHRNSFFVCYKEGCSQSSVSNDTHSNIISETTVSSVDNKDSYSNDTYASNTSTGSSSYSYASAVMKSDTGYVGLVNQAMTCYLNSLLQTLYMTPEFRNAVYRWEYDGSEGEATKSIPYQLQRLFLQLQISSKRAVETTDITRSFGWDSSDAWQQHDVQELCRVMFDALEKSWKNTDQSNLITHLYQGKIKDYVKCLKCGSESARTDTYLDIPLVVRPFGANIGYSSVEEALRAFVEYETLDGTNQYFCEKCNCKSDAHKGLKFLTFPYLLTMQLKRFDFDYSTMHRIKLNDRMSFPERLSLGQFIDTENESLAPVKESGDIPVVCADGNECGDSGSAGSNTDEVDEGIDIGDTASGTTATRSPSDFSDAGRHRKIGRSNDLEPFVYELFSIMVHSGGASGGHYYAYIKSFKDSQWYSFNDQHVYRIAQDDIEKTFGGSSFSSGYYSSYSSSANAYMLMYRQVDPTRNKQFMQQEDFPPHLLRELEHLKHKDEEEQQQREIEKNTCKIKLYHFDDNTQRYVESKLEVYKNKTLQDATEIAWRLLRPPGVKLANFRLVKFDSIHEYIERSFDNELAAPFYQVLGGVKSVYSFDLLAETKFTNEEFASYSCGDVMVRVNVVDLETESIEPAPTVVRISTQQTVGELKQLIASTLCLQAETMKCVIEKYYNQLYLLPGNARTLHSESFQKTNKLFVECSGVEDDVHFSDSRLFAVLDRHQHTIRMTINVPKMPVSYKKMYLPKSDDMTNHGGDSGSNNAAAADSRSTEMDEGIGESESDVLSAADVDSCPPSVVSAPSAAIPSAGSPEPSKTPPNLESSPILTDIYSVEPSAEQPTIDGDDAMKFQPPVARIHDQLFVDTSVADEQPLATADSGGIADDHVDQMSPTFVTSVSHSLSQDSGSSQTVEVGDGDDVRVPSSGDEDFDAQHISPPITPSPRAGSPSPPALSLTGEVEVGAYCAPPADSTTSPEMDNVKDASTEKESSENWDQDTINMKADDELIAERERYDYCRVDKTVFPLGCERTLIAHVDRRISLKTLKASLEEYIGVTSNNFKVYKVSQSGQEIEETRLSDTLINYPNDAQINIKYGRALQPGEHRVQVYQLVINDPEPMKLRVEVILAKGMTVLDAKKVIVEELSVQNGTNVDIARCRLRRKNWRMPSRIYTNNSAPLEESLGNALNPEILLEVLDEDEKLPADRNSGQLSLYIRRWRPSKYLIEPFQEVYLSDLSLEDTLFKISAVSDIPVNDLCYAKPKGTFPYDISVLEVEKELEWNPNVTLISQWPLSVVDDGCVLFYKDRTEELMELSDEQKKQLQQKENSRLMKQNSSSVSFSHRKERALKIYTADSPAASAPSAAETSKTVTVNSVSELILD